MTIVVIKRYLTQLTCAADKKYLGTKIFGLVTDEIFPIWPHLCYVGILQCVDEPYGLGAALGGNILLSVCSLFYMQ